MTFDKGDVWRPPHCTFIGVYRYEQDSLGSSPSDDINGYAPDYTDHVPESVPYFAVVRESDGFADTPTADELSHSAMAHGYDYAIARRGPEAKQVTEDDFFGELRELDEDGYSEDEAHEIAAERFGYDPYREEATDIVFYWPAP